MRCFSRRVARRATRTLCNSAFAILRAVPFPPARRRPATSHDRFLVILLEGLGDGLVFTPAFRALRKTYPHARIDVLANETNREIYRTGFGVDRFLVPRGDSRSLRGFLSIATSLRSGRYDVAITPSLLFRHLILTAFTGASLRAGFHTGGRGLPLTLRHPLDRGKHRVHACLDLVAAVGAARRGDRMMLATEPADTERMRRLLGRLIGGQEGPLVVIHPGAAQEVNRWPEKNYARLADGLRDQVGANIVFSGGKGDRPLTDRVRALMTHAAPSIAGQTTLREFGALLRACDLLVSPDTGAMHAGAAVGAPLVTLMGGRNGPREWSPLSRGAVVIRKEVSCSPCHEAVCPFGTNLCMEEIRVPEVLDACRFVLREGAHSPGKAETRCVV